jgi:hypothetical protein
MPPSEPVANPQPLDCSGGLRLSKIGAGAGHEASHLHIPWRVIAGTGDRIVHEYILTYRHRISEQSYVATLTLL